MTLTAYDRRRLKQTLTNLERARTYVEWVLDGDPDAAMRCAYAGMHSAAATRALDQADRRITRRQKDAT